MGSENKLSERDVITKFILPGIEQAGWNNQSQIREEVSFTDGRIFVKGKKTKRGKGKRADIILFYKSNIPVAVLEAKEKNHSCGDGMQQALEYANILDIPVAISSNGTGFVIQYRKNCGPLEIEGNSNVIENRAISQFPSPQKLWACYKKYNGKEYTKNGILTSYRSLDNFLQAWNDAEKKKIIIEELESLGILFEDLKEEIKSDLDIFDLICHIAWDAPALTRKERADNVRKRNYWTKYGEQARHVLNALLDKYAERGIENIEDMKILTVEPLKDMGTPAEIVKIFGGKSQYLAALKELENEIYKVA